MRGEGGLFTLNNSLNSSNLLNETQKIWDVKDCLGVCDSGMFHDVWLFYPLGTFIWISTNLKDGFLDLVAH